MNKKEKIKVLIDGPYPPPYGGIGIYVRNLLESPVKDHFNLLFLRTASRTSEKKSLIKKLNREIRDAFSLIHYLLKDKDIKIVHIHTSSYQGFWRYSIHVLISKIFFRKVILHIHGGGFNKFYNGQNLIKKHYIRRILSSVNAIIALTPKWNDFFLQIVPNQRIFTISNAVMPLNDLPKRYTGNKINILFLAGLNKDKGIYDFLEGIKKLGKVSNLQFLIAGFGPEEKKVKQICKKLKNVAFVGPVFGKKKEQIYINSDFYVLPSYVEGLPVSLLEAMSAGLPVITTPVGGIPDVINDGENGFLIQPGNVYALKEKILELANNEKLREEMGKRNRELIKQKYSWDMIAEKIMGAYNEVLKRG